MSAEVHFTYGHPVNGSIRFTQAGPESPVQYSVNVEDLPPDILPSPYHIHVKAVLHGDCYTTGGHLNYKKNVDPKQLARYRSECSGATPAGCENGDLASKHGNITLPSFRMGPFTDGDITLYGNETIIGRSVVIHDYMNNRYTCGDIVEG